MAFPTRSYKGILHAYLPNLTAFEYETPALEKSDKPPTLIFVGGLGDGLLTVPFVQEVLLKTGWSIAEASLSSSHNGWGTVTIRDDALELASCVNYFKQNLGRPNVVLMGHSTGSQDVLEYLCRLSPEDQASPGIDGAILQAPVSDREGTKKLHGQEKWEKGYKYAQKMIEEGKGDDIVPRDVLGEMCSCPVTARRWYSLAAPGADAYEDFFSSDISDERLNATFGAVRPATTPFLILFSGDDEFIPHDVDKQGLVQRWIDACKRNSVNVDTENSGIIPGGTHNMEHVGDEVNEDMRQRIRRFLERISSLH